MQMNLEEFQSNGFEGKAETTVANGLGDGIRRPADSVDDPHRKTSAPWPRSPRNCFPENCFNAFKSTNRPKAMARSTTFLRDDFPVTVN